MYKKAFGNEIKMKVLVTGKGGQLAWELEQTVADNVELFCLSVNELDITNQQQVNEIFEQYSPDLVINAAAYTAVDKAETDVENAYAVNALGSEYIANACKKREIKLIHVSTDFVFDGNKTTPYQTNDHVNPINVYGASKLAGDIKVNDILGSEATIIRTAWVYSQHGNNFVKTMLRLMDEKDQLGVVYDQIGTPTWAKGLANMIWALFDKVTNAPSFAHSESAAIYHWTDAGICSWYDFAIAIQELGIEKGMLQKSIPIRPIPASDYPTPARRPSFSVIDKKSAEEASDIMTVHWRKQLSSMMDELKN